MVFLAAIADMIEIAGGVWIVWTAVKHRNWTGRHHDPDPGRKQSPETEDPETEDQVDKDDDPSNSAD